MRTKPHVERLARLLHNRVVRRVLHDHPDAVALLLVGDLSAQDVTGPGAELAQLVPAAVCAGTGALLGGPADQGGETPDDPAARGRWHALCDDLRPEFALLARVSPVQLFVPYVLDLRQLDLRVEADLDVDPSFGVHRPDAD